MTGGEFLLRTIREQGLAHVFLVPGGHIDPLVAELGKGIGLQPIVAAHEQGAGFMADGYARVSGRFAACLGIGGPGAANLLPAAVAARLDVVTQRDCPTPVGPYSAMAAEYEHDHHA
jgi:acetolactate synthase-1/2/3 large subunit